MSALLQTTIESCDNIIRQCYSNSGVSLLWKNPATLEWFQMYTCGNTDGDLVAALPDLWVWQCHSCSKQLTHSHTHCITHSLTDSSNPSHHTMGQTLTKLNTGGTYYILAASPRRRGIIVAKRLCLCIFIKRGYSTSREATVTLHI